MRECTTNVDVRVFVVSDLAPDGGEVSSPTPLARPVKVLRLVAHGPQEIAPQVFEILPVGLLGDTKERGRRDVVSVMGPGQDSSELQHNGPMSPPSRVNINPVADVSASGGVFGQIHLTNKNTTAGVRCATATREFGGDASSLGLAASDRRRHRLPAQPDTDEAVEATLAVAAREVEDAWLTTWILDRVTFRI